MGENSSYLQTVGRSLEILELIGLFPGLTLSEVARQCNMSTTVVYRLLYTLTASGFLQQEPGGKRYFLGDKALLIGAQSLDNREVKRIAQYYMWDYYERTGEHCILTIPCAGRSICIENRFHPGYFQLCTFRRDLSHAQRRLKPCAAGLFAAP